MTIEDITLTDMQEDDALRYISEKKQEGIIESSWGEISKVLNACYQRKYASDTWRKKASKLMKQPKNEQHEYVSNTEVIVPFYNLNCGGEITNESKCKRYASQICECEFEADKCTVVMFGNCIDEHAEERLQSTIDASRIIKEFLKELAEKFKRVEVVLKSSEVIDSLIFRHIESTMNNDRVVFIDSHLDDMPEVFKCENISINATCVFEHSYVYIADDNYYVVTNGFMGVAQFIIIRDFSIRIIPVA